jgi:hypothetical protein
MKKYAGGCTVEKLQPCNRLMHVLLSYRQYYFLSQHIVQQLYGHFWMSITRPIPVDCFFFIYSSLQNLQLYFSFHKIC